MPDIVLSTLNAKYIHAAFGLRYLQANLGSLRQNSAIVEFDIHQRPADIVESLLSREPKIIGLGIYIWNVAQSTEVVALLKRLRPELIIILGGPEVSYETENQPIVQLADHVITGEADLAFAEVCGRLLQGGLAGTLAERLPKIIDAELPTFDKLTLPYDLYSDEDVAQRVIYVEASRGCPFTCEFCLSSLDIPVRQAPIPVLLDHFSQLMKRGAKQLKFVDRTFNLNASVSRSILEFLLERYEPGSFFHFEMVPDRLPEILREVLPRFPAGSLQFEIGVQTFNENSGALIRRRQNVERLEDTFRFLRKETGVHIHADLIAGLPGETLESFAAGFDRLVALGPHEIQVGILKRLRGTTIGRHDAEWQMIYSPNPPYELLRNKLIDFTGMQALRRFARFWDLVSNSGNFVESTPLIWSADGSAFHGFLNFSSWLHRKIGRTDSIALVRLMELLFQYLTGEIKLGASLVAATLWRDYQRGGRYDKPLFMREFLADAPVPVRSGAKAMRLPRRQQRRAG